MAITSTNDGKPRLYLTVGDVVSDPGLATELQLGGHPPQSLVIRRNQFIQSELQMIGPRRHIFLAAMTVDISTVIE